MDARELRGERNGPSNGPRTQIPRCGACDHGGSGSDVNGGGDGGGSDDDEPVNASV